MPLMNGVSNWLGENSDDDESETTGYEAVELSKSDVRSLEAQRPDRPNIVVVPNMDNSGVEGMLDVLEGMHTTSSSSAVSGGDGPPAHSYELAYRKPPNGGERVVSISYHAGNDDTHGPLRRQLANAYSNSEVDEEPARLLNVNEGQYLAGAKLGVRLYTLYPIKNVESDTFRSDPTGKIISELSGSEKIGGKDADVVTQTMFRPEPRDWLTGVPNGGGEDPEGFRAQGSGGQIVPGMGVRDMSETLSSPWQEPRVINPFIPEWWPKWLIPEDSIEYVTHEPTRADRRAAELLEELDSKGWRLCFRIFAVSDSPELAIDRVENTAKMYKNFYEFSTEQTFVDLPLSGDELRSEFMKAAGREFSDDGIVKSNVEVGGLVNVPESDDVSSNKMKWSLAKANEGVPPGTPRADWNSLAIDPANATKEQIQVALLGIDDLVRWYGVGSKHGVEAGIKPGSLMNPHKFIVGMSGAGKTTLLAGDASQQFREPGGGLRIDPNGDDTDDVLAEWPEDRDRDDLIYIDLSGDYDRIPRFNFLEIPDYLDTDSREFETFVQGLAEKILEMVGMAGGTDDYVGSLMARVIMNVVRAMGKMDADVTPTLFDVAAVCSSGDNLEEFAEHMPEDRLHYLRKRVDQMADFDDRELDPLAGRLDDWVLNENIRELICARNPTFSISEAVAEGREIVLRFGEETSDREVRMTSNPFLARTYHAQRHHHPNTQPFELVVDEAQDVLTSASDVVSMLDQGRKYEYRATFACQGTTQFDDTDILKAVLRNVRTFMLFKVGVEEEVDHAIEKFDGVDASDVVKQDKFHFYTATETEDGGDTPGYQVSAFRSPREARIMAAEDRGEDPDASEEEIEERTEELKEHALSKWGITKEELGEAKSVFAADDVTPGEVAADADAGEHSLSKEEQTVETVKAVHDVALSQSLEDGDSGNMWIDEESDRMVNRMAQKVDGSISDATQLAEYYQRAETQGYIERRKEDGERQVRVTDKGLAEAWAEADEGKRDHRLLIADTHALLTARDMHVDIVTGSNMPDFKVQLAEHLRLSTAGMDTGDAIDAVQKHERRLRRDHPEAWHTTHASEMNGEAESSTAGGRQTVKNLAKAYQANKRALFACRKGTGDADDVRRALADPPLCKDETNGIVTLYNDSVKVEDDGIEPVVPNSNTVTWKHDPAVGEWWVENDDGDTVATFSSHDEITDLSAWPVGDTVETTESLPDRSYGRGGDHVRVAAPVTAEKRFGDSWNTVQRRLDDAYVIVEVPENARREPWKEGYIVTDDGDRVPFSALGQADPDDTSTEQTDDDSNTNTSDETEDESDDTADEREKTTDHSEKSEREQAKEKAKEEIDALDSLKF